MSSTQAIIIAFPIPSGPMSIVLLLDLWVDDVEGKVIPLLYDCFLIKSHGLRSRYSITVAMNTVNFLGALIWYSSTEKFGLIFKSGFSVAMVNRQYKCLPTEARPDKTYNMFYLWLCNH